MLLAIIADSHCTYMDFYSLVLGFVFSWYGVEGPSVFVLLSLGIKETALA